jgi:hypothetical protein
VRHGLLLPGGGLYPGSLGFTSLAHIVFRSSEEKGKMQREKVLLLLGGSLAHIVFRSSEEKGKMQREKVLLLLGG